MGFVAYYAHVPHARGGGKWRAWLSVTLIYQREIQQSVSPKMHLELSPPSPPDTFHLPIESLVMHLFVQFPVYVGKSQSIAPCKVRVVQWYGVSKMSHSTTCLTFALGQPGAVKPVQVKKRLSCSVYRQITLNADGRIDFQYSEPGDATPCPLMWSDQPMSGYPG